MPKDDSGGRARRTERLNQAPPVPFNRYHVSEFQIASRLPASAVASEIPLKHVHALLGASQPPGGRPVMGLAMGRELADPLVPDIWQPVGVPVHPSVDRSPSEQIRIHGREVIEQSMQQMGARLVDLPNGTQQWMLPRADPARVAQGLARALRHDVETDPYFGSDANQRMYNFQELLLDAIHTDPNQMPVKGAYAQSMGPFVSVDGSRFYGPRRIGPPLEPAAVEPPPPPPASTTSLAAAAEPDDQTGSGKAKCRDKKAL